jgi:hypothetical protein
MFVFSKKLSLGYISNTYVVLTPRLGLVVFVNVPLRECDCNYVCVSYIPN